MSWNVDRTRARGTGRQGPDAPRSSGVALGAAQRELDGKLAAAQSLGAAAMPVELEAAVAQARGVAPCVSVARGLEEARRTRVAWIRGRRSHDEGISDGVEGSAGAVRAKTASSRGCRRRVTLANGSTTPVATRPRTRGVGGRCERRTTVARRDDRPAPPRRLQVRAELPLTRQLTDSGGWSRP